MVHHCQYYPPHIKVGIFRQLHPQRLPPSLHILCPNQEHFLMLKEPMGKEEKLEFVTAMEKEVRYHEGSDHWELLHLSFIWDAKNILSIWSFQKNVPRWSSTET